MEDCRQAMEPDGRVPVTRGSEELLGGMHEWLTAFGLERAPMKPMMVRNGS